MSFTVGLSNGDSDLDGILALQRANLRSVVTPEEGLRNGFVTVGHTREILERMHALGPSVVARRGSSLVAYALTMTLGQGVFDLLYAGHREHYARSYQLLVTEISARNARSLRAHQRVGFSELTRYRDETDDWVIVALDLRG
jgi:L-amino acid N-acyltransferase YncA